MKCCEHRRLLVKHRGAGAICVAMTHGEPDDGSSTPGILPRFVSCG
jgi:hypothetical protein